MLIDGTLIPTHLLDERLVRIKNARNRGEGTISIGRKMDIDPLTLLRLEYELECDAIVDLYHEGHWHQRRCNT